MKIEKTLAKADQLWQELGDIPVNEDMEIETPFLHFPEGTEAEDIWSWFESHFDISVGERYFGWKTLTFS